MEPNTTIAKSDVAMLLVAVQFAAQKHADQWRKDVAKTPYINHCIDVAEALASVGWIEDARVLQAALLHDTVEDTGATVEEIARQFGGRVASMVQEVTDDRSLPADERKVAQVCHAPLISSGAQAIKVADKLCNCRDISSESPIGWTVGRKMDYVAWSDSVVSGCNMVPEELRTAFSQVAAAKRAEIQAWAAAENKNIDYPTEKP